MLYQWVDFHTTAYLLAAPLAMLLNRKLSGAFRGEQALLNRLFAAAALGSLLLLSLEIFRACSSEDEMERYGLINRATGPYWWAFWSMIAAYGLAQLFWLRRLQHSTAVAASCLVLQSVTLLFPLLLPLLPGRDYLPSSWMMFSYQQLFLVPLAGLMLLEAILLRRLLAWLRRSYSR
ncbi:hypothetical protein HNQ93_001051 [Hymenobacter luteus]|uniref:Uncharacterized protein n=2 Tax=Hymenobacter TaxID=89966 RepID=A0A7W9WBD1_9BACT|nr:MULTISPECIES: hypothetical protein [Hymenobacter]MBB4599469.1 hypothetical protein [Hymenobacter latericoloratus]MBB6058221.1 hypothetical protein [Hymenobacter luteus]